MADLEAIADTLVENHLEDAIEAAQAAGDHDRAQELYRQSMGVDAEDGPDNDTSGIQPGTSMAEYEPYDDVSEDQKDEAFEGVLALSDPDTARGILQAEWPGAEYDKNVEFAASVLGAVSNSAKALRVLEAVGVADHPDLVRWLASAGRLMADVPGDPNSIPTPHKGTAMDSTIGGNIEAQIDALQDQIDKAQAVNNDTKANTLYQKQLALERLLPGGSEPIVGSEGRTA